jgi:hypothetical protein
MSGNLVNYKYRGCMGNDNKTGFTKWLGEINIFIEDDLETARLLKQAREGNKSKASNDSLVSSSTDQSIQRSSSWRQAVTDKKSKSNRGRG